MVSTLRESIQFLESIGFLNVILPFLFVFTIVYGMLERTKIFGNRQKNVHAMIAFVVGFIFIASVSRVDSLILYLQIFGMGLLAIVAIAYVFALVQSKMFFSKHMFFNVLLLVFVILALFASLGWLNNLPYQFFIDLIVNPVVIIVLSFLGLLWYIMSGKSTVVQKKEKVKSKSDKTKFIQEDLHGKRSHPIPEKRKEAPIKKPYNENAPESTKFIHDKLRGKRDFKIPKR